MIITRNNSELSAALAKWRYNPDASIGFVPTMGYLHQGHTSLIDQARKENTCVVVSIFVNPTQFGPSEDFESYPRDEERDFKLCKQHGADIIFVPEIAVMYPEKTLTYVSVKELTSCLCGRYRPGHFDGVTTIVAKLFLLVTPHRAYFGQKDAQQVLVIQRMVRELLFPIDIRIGSTVREKDGLAMSSRNVRISDEKRGIAALIYKGLTQAVNAFRQGEIHPEKLLRVATQTIETSDELKIQYLEIRRQDTLEPVSVITQPAILATAVYLDGVRLIDNVFLDPTEISQ